MSSTRQACRPLSILIAMLAFDRPPTAAATLLQNNARESPQSFTDAICSGRSDGRLSCEVEVDVPSQCAATVEETSTCPIVLYLHGSGGTNDWFARTTDVHNAGYIGVYPQGEGGWNTGPKSTNVCDSFDYECKGDPDEGDFIAAIIYKLKNMGAAGNVYAIGNSNGAALAHRLASNSGPDIPISGIVVKVTQLLASPDRSGPGSLNYNQPSEDRGTRKVSLLSVMGTDDGLIPYEGGPSSVLGGSDSPFELMSALDSMSKWAGHNKCSGASAPVVSTHTYISRQGTTGSAIKYDYLGCPSGIIVEHYAIEGGGHNAGGVSIDGENVDYVVAYDFINRIEAGNGGGGGGGEGDGPNSSLSPTPAPDPPTGSCTNDATWAGKFNVAHNCEFVAQDPTTRCNFENAEGINANDACPEACDPGCSTSSMPSPSPSPTEPNPSILCNSICSNNPTPWMVGEDISCATSAWLIFSHCSLNTWWSISRGCTN